MPTYEYECTKCGHRFELVQSIQDPPRRRCPRCRGKVKKLISGGAGITFKGTGYYVTDSRRKDRKRTETEKPSAEAKTDTKPSS